MTEYPDPYFGHPSSGPTWSSCDQLLNAKRPGRAPRRTPDKRHLQTAAIGACAVGAAVAVALGLHKAEEGGAPTKVAVPTASIKPWRASIPKDVVPLTVGAAPPKTPVAASTAPPATAPSTSGASSSSGAGTSAPASSTPVGSNLRPTTALLASEYVEVNETQINALIIENPTIVNAPSSDTSTPTAPPAPAPTPPGRVVTPPPPTPTAVPATVTGTLQDQWTYDSAEQAAGSAITSCPDPTTIHVATTTTPQTEVDASISGGTLTSSTDASGNLDVLCSYTYVFSNLPTVPSYQLTWSDGASTSPSTGSTTPSPPTVPSQTTATSQSLAGGQGPLLSIDHSS